MKTVAQWAEQLPELIRIEFLYEAEKQEVSNRILVNPSAIINTIIWIDTFLGTDFWNGVASCFYETPKSADYLDETIPYTKEEVEEMILEYADPNDEVCKVMLWNLAKPKEVNYCSPIIEIQQNEHCYIFPMREGENLQQFAKRIEQENEALKSTIDGLNSIVEKHKVEIEQLKQKVKDNDFSLFLSNEIEDGLREQIKDLENNNHELLEKTKPTPQHKPSLLQRFINWLS